MPVDMLVCQKTVSSSLSVVRRSMGTHVSVRGQRGLLSFICRTIAVNKAALVVGTGPGQSASQVCLVLLLTLAWHVSSGLLTARENHEVKQHHHKARPSRIFHFSWDRSDKQKSSTTFSPIIITMSFSTEVIGKSNEPREISGLMFA